jgi:hypothetical protein
LLEHSAEKERFGAKGNRRAFDKSAKKREVTPNDVLNIVWRRFLVIKKSQFLGRKVEYRAGKVVSTALTRSKMITIRIGQ